MEEMEELKQPQKVFSHLGFCYIAGTATIYLLQIAIGILVKKYWPELMEDMSFQLILSGITVYGCGMPLIVLLTRSMQKDDIERHEMKWWQFLLGLFICYALVYASNMVGILLTSVIGLMKGGAVQNDLVSVITDGDMLLNFVLMVIIAPIVEEYVFRKVIVDRTVRYGQGVAIAASGLMFGLFHGNLNQFAYAVVLGAFFAFLYVKTGNLKITIGMHAIVNFMGSMIAGSLLKHLHYEELLKLDTSDEAAMVAFFMDNLDGWLIFAAYALLLFAVVITGIVLFIVALVKKKFVLEPGREQLPKGYTFHTLIVNPGMLVFCAVWIVLIVIQLLS